MRSGIAAGAYGTTARARLGQLFARLEGDTRAASWALAIAWAATRLVLFVGMVASHNYCDPEFYKYAGLFAVGQWPYRNVPVEYPPLAIMLLLLPALPLLPFSGIAPRPDPAFDNLAHLPQPDPLRYGAYGVSFAVEMLMIDALTLWLLRRAARRHLASDPQGLRTGLLYVVLVFVSGALLQKFDLTVGTLCLIAVVALAERRTRLAWGALAAAALVKGFPLLALPVFVGYELQHVHARGVWAALHACKRELLRGVITCGCVLAAPALLVIAFAGLPAVVQTITYHADRGIEIESLYANVILALGWLPGLSVTTAFHAADLSRVVHSRLESVVDPVGITLSALFLLAAYSAIERPLFRMRSQRKVTGAPLQMLIAGVTCVLLAFVLAFRALPAHYLLVVLPLAALLRLPSRRHQRVWLGGLAGVMALGQVVEVVWHEFVGLVPWAVLILTVRNIAWILAFTALVVALWQWPVELIPNRHVGERGI